MIHTLKSILARPAHTISLFIEIIIVTVIGWIAIEPVAVRTTTASLAAGYDVDRLVSVSFSYLTTDAEEFDSTLFNAENIRKEKDQLLNMMRDRKYVASATFHTFMSLEQSSCATSYIEADSLYRNSYKEGGDNKILVYKALYVPHTDYFKTFGIKDSNGKQFEEPVMVKDNWIVSRTLAQALNPDGLVIGTDLFPFDEEDPEARHSPIAAITGDITYSKDKGRTAVAFQPILEGDYGWLDGITIRVADGVSPEVFCDHLNNDLNDLRCGNTYLTEPNLYSNMRDELFADKQKDLTQKWIILGFFLINVFLGIAGTFYVQCRTRIPDAGVMRAFGATRNRIKLNIVGEAWLTVFIGWVIGSLLYLIYLHYQAIPMETDADDVIQAIRPLWYDTKLGRYSIVGGIVLIIIIITATLGSYLPARKVSRVNPVEALRDE